MTLRELVRRLFGDPGRRERTRRELEAARREFAGAAEGSPTPNAPCDDAAAAEPRSEPPSTDSEGQDGG